MMQKNESILLEYWIRYHASIFGAGNLYIFDNGSTCKKSLATLEHYESEGVNVIREFTSSKHFHEKGEIIANLIKKLEATCDHDFFFPLDCDEFIGAATSSGKISCSKVDIDFELQNNIDSKDAHYIQAQLFNPPVSPKHFWTRRDRKCFFRSKTIDSLDEGFHFGSSKNKGEHRTNIIQFHLHNKPFSLLQEHAREKLKLCLPDFSKDTLSNYKGPGVHLTQYLIESEVEYLQRLLSNHYIKTPALLNKLRDLHLEWPYQEYCSSALRVIQNVSTIEEKFAGNHGFIYDPLHHKIHGHIDTIAVSNHSIITEGWACDPNWNTVIGLIAIKPDGKLISPTSYQPIARSDVSKVHTAAPEHCGFIAHFPQSELACIDEIEFHAVEHPNVIGSPLKTPMSIKNHT